MAKPASRQQLIDYCLRKLGAPVLEINLDDDQIDDSVDDAIQLFNERHFDGVERMFLKYKITQEDLDRGRAFTQVYNDPFLKLYLTALMKRQWGQNLIKFRGVKLPGGIELNGREIFDDAERDIESLRSRMASEYELPPYDFVG